MSTRLRARTTYGDLLQVRGIRRLVLASLSARTAQAMSTIVVVLFALQRFHSAPLAGASVFAASVPGLVLSPLAGALLDRHRRIRLIRLDYSLVAAAMLSVVLLDLAGRLTPLLLVGVIGVGSLSLPLSTSGTRSLFPLMVPTHLWDRANAVDSAGYVAASIAGPALAGVVAGLVSPRAGIAGVSLLYAGAVVGLLGMPEPAPPDTSSQPSLLRAAHQGVSYVLHHATLRAIALVTTVLNLGFGVLTVALPVLVITHLHSDDTAVGLLWALAGVTGIGGVTLAGRLDTTGREGRLMVASVAVQAVGLSLLVVVAAIGGGLALTAVAMGIFGVATGPYDVGMFSLRQRVTEPTWIGRAFAVSMSLNWVGAPVASLLVGPAVGPHLTAALVAAMAAMVASAVLGWILLGRPTTVRRYNDPSPAARREDSGCPQGGAKEVIPDRVGSEGSRRRDF